ncbi:hypothetical protein MZTS_22360 [Methylorubrum zatmanii]|uniref:HTH cro/C1-type domain-containing protein n=1 Tax=Methylorubrum zatmanii TaxID=29429 RepID=A0ABW1WRT9_9HYPH|nr:hypothetical protein [Methylorubrum zatmanii]
MEERVLPEHTEDLGGITAVLVDAVREYRCPGCDAVETEIPDMQGLVRSVALLRALFPYQLTGGDLRLMRRALDMNQKEFAEAMELTPETMNRWERGGGAGGATEKLLRHNVCALLHRFVPAIDYDPAQITKMAIKKLPEGAVMPPIKVRRVVMKRDHHREDAWDTLCEAA